MFEITSPRPFNANGPLVLSRREGESVEVDGRVTVKVVEADRGYVKLAFVGDGGVIRTELTLKAKEEASVAR